MTSSVNRILELSQGHIVSRLVMLAAQWKLNELVGHEPQKINDIANKVQCHPDAFYRYMRVLAAHGVVEIVDDASVKSTDLTLYLDRLLSPHILDSYRLFQEVEHSLKTNEASWSQAFQKPFYSYLVENRDKFVLFEKWCSKTSADWLPVVSSLYPFNQFKKIIDVGGGQGDFLMTLLEKTPTQTGILFDKPQVIEKAKTLLPPSLASRLETIGGDFLVSVPQGGDLYIICRSLLNWNDEDAIKIINHCYDAMQPSARLLVIDFVIPEVTHPHYMRGVLNDMSLLAALNSSHCTQKQWSDLITQTKFSSHTFHETESKIESEPFIPLCLIEAIKK